MALLHRAPPKRLAAFSGGVFAVLITVRVLELPPPENADLCRVDGAVADLAEHMP